MISWFNNMRDKFKLLKTTSRPGNTNLILKWELKNLWMEMLLCLEKVNDEKGSMVYLKEHSQV